MIPADGGGSVSINLKSLEDLASQLKALLGVADRHRDLGDAVGIPWDLPLWSRLPQTRDFRGQTVLACGQAYEVVKELDKLCVALQSATQQVVKDFADDDRLSADELRALGDRYGSHSQGVA